MLPLNLRLIIVISIALSAMMIVYVHMNSKKKNEYQNSTGQITYLDKELGQLPARNKGKYRYLAVDSYEYPFEIFVGNESGDFKPKSEQIDNLKPGDTITVFFYETDNTKNEGINRFIQFIDKGDNSFFERGDSSKTLGIVVISLCGLLTIGGVILWKMKKINF
jgi:hypothetical protein